jgi:O-antigen ligase
LYGDAFHDGEFSLHGRVYDGGPSYAVSVSASQAAARLAWWRRLPYAIGASGWMLPTLLGGALLLRVLTDDLASPYSRQSGSLNLSSVIALTFVLLACWLLLAGRRGVLPALLAASWLCVWTATAVITHGASTETLREGVREGSAVAIGVVVYNASGTITVPIAARIVQFIGVAPALLAVYQLATHTGMDLAGTIRANGTFAHPDSAAMFFAIAAATSLWLYLDGGKRLIDAALVVIFSAGVIATLSIDGLAALVAMLLALGVLRPGSFRVKRMPFLLAAAVIVAFLANPVGIHRIAKESATSLAIAERGEANTSLDWRLHKWETLLPQWEASPFFGQGLGTTTTTEPEPGNRFAGKPPHNEYVRYLVETGVVGLALLLVGLAFLVRALMRIRRRRGGSLGDTNLKASTLALTILVGCLVNSLADNTLLNSPTCYGAALIIAAVLGMPAQKARSGEVRQATATP